MKKKYIALIILLLVIVVVGLLEYTQGTVSAAAFDQMKYQFNSNVQIPPNTPNGSSLGGYYSINGTGRDFKMLLVLSGAEKGESPLDYTSDGLKVTGHIDTVKATPQTIIYFLQKDVKTAMFNTIFTGNMNMTCAAWTGTSLFQNDGQNFNGTFIIDGVVTDWRGNYTLTQDQNRIVLTADYIYYPKDQPDSYKTVQKVYYL